MLISAVSVLVVAQSSSEIPEGLMNNPVYNLDSLQLCYIRHLKLEGNKGGAYRNHLLQGMVQ